MFGDNKFIGPYRIAGHDGANYILKECDSEVILSRRVTRHDIKLSSVVNKNRLPGVSPMYTRNRLGLFMY
jgi:hypothetical protein